MTAPWYRCFPRDFNEGMDGLTLEERGAYITLINLIYARGGPIPEDVWWLTSKLGCTTRTWTKIRASLIVKRKLYEVEVAGDPHLMNARAADEIAERQEFSGKKSSAGKTGGRNSGASRRKNNDLGEANTKQTRSKHEAIHIHSHRGSVSPPNGEDTGGEPPNPDQKAWTEGPVILVALGGMSLPAAKRYFGGLLSRYGLQPRDMLPAIGECEATGTQDPQGLMAGYAKQRGSRRQTGPPKRVGFV